MVGKWPSIPIGEVADSISDTHIRDKKQLVFLNTSDILYGKVLHRQYSKVSDWPGQAKKSIRRDDILFSEIRPANGRWAYIDFDAEDYVVSTKLMVIRGRPGKVFPRFLYHFLSSPQITRWLQYLAESRSGTFPQITFDQVSEIECCLPPLNVQMTISSFLDFLHGKIELNRSTAETLQGIVRAIFKSWFVDFDPVRAKVKGRPTGLSDDLTVLFPDRFGENGLPEGWTTEPITRLFEVSGGNTPSTDDATLWGGPHQWATPKDLSALQSPILLGTARQLSDAGLQKCGSGLLPVGSLLLSSRAPIGYMAFVTQPTAINQGFAGIIKRNVSTTYAWGWCTANMDMITGNAGGSTFPEISKSVLRQLPMLVPPLQVLDAFAEITEALVERITASAQEVQTLASLRDTLLPKLISGDLRISAPKRGVAAA